MGYIIDNLIQDTYRGLRRLYDEYNLTFFDTDPSNAHKTGISVSLSHIDDPLILDNKEVSGIEKMTQELVSENSIEAKIGIKAEIERVSLSSGGVVMRVVVKPKGSGMHIRF